MNKKFLIIGIALIMLLVATTLVFASASVTYTPNSIRVINTTTGTIPRVDVCVMYTDAAGVRRETSISFFNVTPRGETRRFDLGTVIGAYSTFCAVPE
ncbi:MAG: hypothetical protein FWC05_04730 [Treponema sp.]|nr:hypothetical protein [Treponema sp.]